MILFLLYLPPLLSSALIPGFITSLSCYNCWAGRKLFFFSRWLFFCWTHELIHELSGFTQDQHILCKQTGAGDCEMRPSVVVENKWLDLSYNFWLPWPGEISQQLKLILPGASSSCSTSFALLSVSVQIHSESRKSGNGYHWKLEQNKQNCLIAFSQSSISNQPTALLHKNWCYGKGGKWNM